MAEHGGEVVLQVVFSNQESLDAFEEALELLVGLHEDIPWKPELAEAIEKLKFASETIDVAGDEDDDCEYCDTDADVTEIEISYEYYCHNNYEGDGDDINSLDWLGPSDN